MVELARILDKSVSQTLCSYHMKTVPGGSQSHTLPHQQPVVSSGFLIATNFPPLALSLCKLHGCSLHFIVLAQILTQIKKSK